MKRSRKTIPRVLFNASVILSGLRSPQGGSGVLLASVAKRTIRGVVSETIVDEVLQNSHKAGYTKERAQETCDALFSPILPAPSVTKTRQYEHVLRDANDTHLFASYDQAGCNYLVSLDKPHILSLQGMLKGKIILAPAELLEALRKHR